MVIDKEKNVPLNTQQVLDDESTLISTLASAPSWRKGSYASHKDLVSVLCAEEESAALGVGRLWDAEQFQAALFNVVLGVHLHLPMYMPGVGVCARLVIEKSTRIFLPSRTIEKNV